MDQFLELIADARPQAIGEDNLLWKKEKKERFQVKLSMTHVLRIRAIPSPKKKLLHYLCCATLRTCLFLGKWCIGKDGQW